MFFDTLLLMKNVFGNNLNKVDTLLVIFVILGPMFSILFYYRDLIFVFPYLSVIVIISGFTLFIFRLNLLNIASHFFMSRSFYCLYLSSHTSHVFGSFRYTSHRCMLSNVFFLLLNLLYRQLSIYYSLSSLCVIGHA